MPCINTDSPNSMVMYVCIIWGHDISRCCFILSTSSSIACTSHGTYALPLSCLVSTHCHIPTRLTCVSVSIVFSEASLKPPSSCSSTKPADTTFRVDVYGSQKEEVQKVVAKIDALLDDNKTREEWSTGKMFSGTLQQKIRDVGPDFGVIIEIVDRMKAVVSGYKPMVEQAVNRIKEYAFCHYGLVFLHVRSIRLLLCVHTVAYACPFTFLHALANAFYTPSVPLFILCSLLLRCIF